ncbi:hypothetical protein B0H21DRAFT_695862 [Amylocystis lapponica]|nr:hypothetical protein B0H21DRAFT_695862 [Amylocystis lapponica]
MSQEPIIFYDIPSAVVKDSAWSPNTWKTRFVLNYKGIAHKTVWVEYPDIARVCQEIGAAPTSTTEDGSPLYTLPAIHDPSTKTSVSDSAAIARYLDKTYPDTPVVIPAGTAALHAALDTAIATTVQTRLLKVMMLPTNNQLNPVSEAFFRRTREERLGKLEALSPPGPIRENNWAEVRKALGTVAQWMAANGEETSFFLGDTIRYADIVVAGWLVWVKKVYGPDSPEWADVKTWDGGKWARFMESFEVYEVVKA